MTPLNNPAKGLCWTPGRTKGCFHRNFRDFAAMVLFDAYRIIGPVATNTGAGQTGQDQEEPEVRLHIDTRLIQHDKS